MKKIKEEIVELLPTLCLGELTVRRIQLSRPPVMLVMHCNDVDDDYEKDVEDEDEEDEYGGSDGDYNIDFDGADNIDFDRADIGTLVLMMTMINLVSKT